MLVSSSGDPLAIPLVNPGDIAAPVILPLTPALSLYCNHASTIPSWLNLPSSHVGCHSSGDPVQPSALQRVAIRSSIATLESAPLGMVCAVCLDEASPVQQEGS